MRTISSILLAAVLTTAGIAQNHWNPRPNDIGVVCIFEINDVDLSALRGAEMTNRDEIGVFDNDLCVGNTVWPETNIVAYPDDPRTEELDGFQEFNDFHFLIYDREMELEISTEYQSLGGSSVFLFFGMNMVNIRDCRWIMPESSHWRISPLDRGRYDHSFLLIPENGFLRNFDEVAIFTEANILAGTAIYHEVLNNNNDDSSEFGIAAFSFWEESGIGFQEGESFQLIGWDHSADEEFPIDHTIDEGDSSFQINGLTIAFIRRQREGNGVRLKPAVPTGFLLSAYPNPFNGMTTINFNLPNSASVKASVFDLNGRRVTVLIDSQQPAGRQSIGFDASALAGDQYFLRFETPFGVRTQTLTLIK